MTMQTVTRRRFLATAAAGAGVAALSASPLALAIEPVKRDPSRKMQLSMAAYSMRKYLTAKPGTEGAMDMMGFVDYCKKLGTEGTEPTSYFFPKEVTDDYLDSLKKHCKDSGLIISSGAIGNNFTIEPGPKLDSQIKLTRDWIHHYARLGAPIIRVFAGRPEKGVSDDEAINRAVPVLEKMCEEAGKAGLKLAIENHDFTMRVEPLMKIIKAVKSPHFGVNFDSGNFHSEDPYADMAAIAPYAVTAQIKTEIQPAGKPKQPADLKRVINLLRDAGYNQWIVLEYEGAEDPYKAIPGHIETLRGLIKS